MLITAYFSTDGVATTGLSPSLDVVNIATGAQSVSGQAMSAVTNADGWYKYEWANYIPGNAYVFEVDGGSDALDNRYITQTSDGSAEDVWGYERA